MGSTSMEKCTDGIQSDYDRMKQVKAFDEAKMGVKGLVDSGLKSLPEIFIRPPNELLEEAKTPCVELQVPVVDLGGLARENKRDDEIVKQVLDASEKWGFFQVVNHGIPLEVLDNMLKGVRMFHEQDVEAKRGFYTRDPTKQVIYNTNFDLYKSRAANWRDTLVVTTFSSGHLDPEKLPEICRDVMLEYIRQVMKLGDMLLELLSVALGLGPDHLKDLRGMENHEGWGLSNHYYPACPAPKLTLGSSKHTDPSFLTILLQDQIGGLQVLHDNQWVDVQPIPGSFVVNIGDILQMISNDKLQSVYHRVTANRVGPRISIAFFLNGLVSSPKLFGPIKELLSEDNPPVYREFTLSEFFTQFFSRPLDERGFEYFKVRAHGDDK